MHRSVVYTVHSARTMHNKHCLFAPPTNPIPLHCFYISYSGCSVTYSTYTCDLRGRVKKDYLSKQCGTGSRRRRYKNRQRHVQNEWTWRVLEIRGIRRGGRSSAFNSTSATSSLLRLDFSKAERQLLRDDSERKGNFFPRRQDTSCIYLLELSFSSRRLLQSLHSDKPINCRALDKQSLSERAPYLARMVADRATKSQPAVQRGATRRNTHPLLRKAVVIRLATLSSGGSRHSRNPFLSSLF